MAASALSMPAMAATITNGDFEAGNNGFTSAYTYHAEDSGSQSELYPAGSYGVGTNANDYHNLWASFGDHTSGSGNYLIANGAGSTVPVWTSSSIAVGPGKYELSLWLAALYPVSPALLSITANDGSGPITLGANVTPGSTPAVWSNFTSGLLTVNAATNFTFSIVDTNTAPDGNDFGFDDISLVKVGDVPEPASWAMMLGGFGLMGATMRRRRDSLTYA
jgi:hypothetical protein